MSEEMKFFWNTIKTSLDLEGLEEVKRLHPELREEAEELAKPKRLKAKFLEVMRSPRARPAG